MATSTPPKKKHIAGSILDNVGWVIGQAALPIPDFMYDKMMKGKKKQSK
jgi:hypothetical protein